jgi:Domain of unknown function (DUF4157)
MSKAVITAERDQARTPRGRTARDERTRRPARTWSPRALELGEVVASAGHPLDPGLRREMESRLGHDFTQVRIHTDRDAAALTALLGADAVTVGQDVYFGDGTFQPWSDSGRRLIAHELMHTVQAPHVSGALRAGREAGAVSMPHEPLERQAEEEARQPGESADPQPGRRDHDVRQHAPAAAWLRYATVTAEQRRTEQLDPATVIERLAAGVLRSLRGDPADSSKRVRLHLARLGPELRSAVLDKLEVRLPSAPYQQVRRAVSDLEQDAAPLPVQAQPGPEPVGEPEAVGTRAGRDEARGSEAGPAGQPRQDTSAQAGQLSEEQDRADRDKADRDGPTGQRNRGEEQAAGRQESDALAAGAEAKKKAQAAGAEVEKTAHATDAEAEKKAQANGAEAEKEKEAQAADAGAKDKEHTGEEAGPQRTEKARPGAASGKDAEPGGEEGSQRPPAQPERGPGGSAAAPAAQPGAGAGVGTAPTASATLMGLGGAPPVREDRVDAIAEEPGGPLARHRLTARPGRTDEHQPEEMPPGEQPEGLDADVAGQAADVEEHTPDPPELPPQKPVPPDAYLPGQDIDVSAVPSAEEIGLPASGTPPAPPAAPSFPAPPEPELRPGEPDPVEESLEQQDRRDGADIGQAPGQIGPDAATEEPDTATEPSGQGGQEAGTAAGDTAAPGTTAAGPAGDLAADGMGGPGSAGGVLGGQTAGGETAGGEGAGGSPLNGIAAQPGVAAADGQATGAPGGLAPDASLEAGGGPCAGGPEPSAVAGLDGAAAGAGGGGGGGGAPGGTVESPAPAVPDVEQQEPDAALATVGQLPAATMLTSLDRVDASVNRGVGQERDDLAEAPPQLERPAGAPQTLHGAPEEAAPASHAPDKLKRTAPHGPGRQAKPEAKAVVGAPTPVSQVQPPRVTGDQSGKITDADVQVIEEAVDSVPTTDPALDHASVGVAPTVALSGETDPALTDQQLGHLQEKSADLLAAGREDADKPLGENRIYPDVPHETLTAKVPRAAQAGRGGATGAGGMPAGGTAAPGAAAPGGAAAAGGAAGGPEPVGDQALSAIAQQERGEEIQGAVAGGQDQMAGHQQTRQEGEQTENQKYQEQLDATIKEHADEQTAERVKARRAARDERAQWRAGQDEATKQADTGSRREHDGKRDEIARTKSDTDEQISTQQREDNESIAAKRREAEEKARKRKEEDKEPSGWLSRIGSAIRDAFNALVDAIKDIFNAVRKAVQDIINKFKTIVTGLIDAARRAIVGLINKLADALILISDTLLAAFPDLRDKFRKRIEKLRDDAIRDVNKIADRLKTAVTKLLDALGKALTALLDALEKGLLAAVQFVRSVVEGVINFVKNAIALLGEFAAIIADVAIDPGGWIGKLKDAVVDGIKFHLWDAIKTAVKQWFDEKVEEIIGLGKMVINVLIKGCISMAKIARMVWEALISALPTILIEVVITQLVAMLIPGLGAIMTIVRAAIAAYHAISKIIAALGKFVAFLKAVRSGQAARPFAEAVAAGVVALLELIASFLMSKLGGAAKGVATRLKGIADRIMKLLARGVKAVKKGIGAAVNLAKRGAKAAAGAIKRGFHAVARAGKRGAKVLAGKARSAVAAIGRGARALGGRLAKTRLGKALSSAGTKLKAKYRQFKAKVAAWREKRKKWREDRKKNKPTPEQRLERAAERIRPKVNALLKLGIWRRALDATLAAFRAWYRLSGLSVIGEKVFRVEARLNPQVEIAKGVSIDRDKLLRFIHELGAELRKATDAERAAGFSTFSAHVDPATGRTTTTRTVRGGGAGLLAENIDTAGGRLAERRQVGDADIIQFVGQGSAPAIDVKSELALGGDPRNFTVNVPNPHTGVMTDRPSYKKLKEWIHGMPPKRRQDMAGHMISFLGDTTQMVGRGDDDRFIKSAAVWTVLAEGKRNPAAMVTHAMALDMVAQGRMSWKTAFKMMPMAKPVIWKTNPTTGRKTRTPGPVYEADLLETHLFGKRGLRSKRTMRLADQIANREANIIQAWVSRMNIEFDNTSTKEERERQLMEAIRKRMTEIYRRAGAAQERLDTPGGSDA